MVVVGLGVVVAVQRHVPLTTDHVPLQGPEQTTGPAVVVTNIGAAVVVVVVPAPGQFPGKPLVGTKNPRDGQKVKPGTGTSGTGTQSPVFGQLPPVQHTFLLPEGHDESGLMPLREGSQAAHVGVEQLPFPPEQGRTTGAEQETVGGLTLKDCCPP